MAITIKPAENLDILYFTLKKEQPQELEHSLKKLLLDKLVRETKGRVKKNNVTMQEIVDEVNTMRKERNKPLDSYE